MAFYTPDSKGNAPSGLNVGDLVKTAGGVYEITQPNAVGANYNPDSGYWSVLADPMVIASNKIVDQARELAATNTAKSQEFAREQMNFQSTSNAKAMEFNAAEAERNRQWQADMSNTAHQREVQDLISAGLNPVLSASGGNGAAVTSGATASGYSSSGAAGTVDNSYLALLNKIIDSSTAIKTTALNNKTQSDIAALNAMINQNVADIHAAATLGSANITAQNAMNMLGLSQVFEDYVHKTYPNNGWQAVAAVLARLADKIPGSGNGRSSNSSDDVHGFGRVYINDNVTSTYKSDGSLGKYPKWLNGDEIESLGTDFQAAIDALIKLMPELKTWFYGYGGSYSGIERPSYKIK